MRAVLLLLSCADEPVDTAVPKVMDEDGLGASYGSWSGEADFQWGWETDPSTRGCQLHFTTSGAAADLCPDCDWAFDVTFTYVEERSVDHADCFADMGGETDFTWRLGLDADYYTYQDAVLWYYSPYAYTWTPVFSAFWAPPQLQWGAGDLASEHMEDGETMWFTSYWSGNATLQ